MSHKGTYYLGNEFFVYTQAIDSSGNPTGTAKPFAYSTECTLSLSANQIDTSNKQSGVWASALPGQISWSISTSALYTSANNYDEIYEAFSTRKPLYVTFGQVADIDHVDTSTGIALDSSVSHYSGTAYITSLELNAGNNEVASFSCEFTGEGKLAKLPTT